MRHTQILSRYVKKNAFFSILYAVLGLWLLQLFFSYLDQLESLSDTYSYIDALRYIGYRSPYFLEQFISTGALLGSVIGLGILANNSELIVMRAAGISIYRIVGWVLQPALLFVILALGVNQFVLPKSNQLANQINNPDRPLLTSVNGYWSLQQIPDASDEQNSAASTEITFIDYADEKGNIGIVKRWQLDKDNNLISVSKALDGQYMTATDTLSERAASYQWQLNGLTMLHLSAIPKVSNNMAQPDSITKPPLLTKTQQDTGVINLPIAPSSVYLLTQRAEDLSLTELYDNYRFNNAKNTRSLEHELSFWQKLLSPFSILSLVIVACSFVFGSLRTHSLGLRVVIALLFGLLFSYLQDLTGFISLATGVSPLLMVMLPIFFSALLGIFLIKKQM